MQIEPKYLNPYLHDVAVEQLADRYNREGYTVQRAVPLGEAEADLLISKADKHIIVEVKSRGNGKNSTDFRNNLLALRNFALEHPSYSLQMVVATEPRRKKIEVKGLSGVLFEFLTSQPVADLTALPTPYQVKKVTEVEVDELNLLETGEVEAVGTGVVEVNLYIAPSPDNEGQGFTTQDKYPFDFHVLLNPVERDGLAIKEVKNLAIDTSSF